MTPTGTLTDTGPLFALVDPKGQPQQHSRCQTLLPLQSLPLVSTWPCFSEAMYMTGKAGGWAMQKLVAEYVEVGMVRLHTPSEMETRRILVLMDRYQDRPMDLADASLIALAETLDYTRIFSIDSDFYVYRLADDSALEVVLEPVMHFFRTAGSYYGYCLSAYLLSRTRITRV
ncbi:MAG: type II toxin-antitoxin system VapC family toxin, partial [Janthinobacterium lividum]